MTITTTALTKAAAAATVTAGAIFVVVQIGHPGIDQFGTETAQWVARSCAKVVMAALTLAGLTGIYLRQRQASGVLGLVGYLLFSAGYLAMFSVELIGATVLPVLTTSNPAFVTDALNAAIGNTPAGDIGALQTLFNLAGFGYIVGGLIFGIATYRAHVLARWAAALLAVSTAGTAALAVLPDSFNRPFAVPTGIALIGLGLSLWANPTDLPSPISHQHAPQPAVTR